MADVSKFRPTFYKSMSNHLSFFMFQPLSWKSDSLATISALILSIAMIVVFAVFTGFLLYAAVSVYRKREGYKKFESVFSGFRIDKKEALAYHNIFMMRRTLVLLMVVYFT